MRNPEQQLPPGFRFHPTDEELILHYLKNKAISTPCPVDIIAEVDIYKLDPWDLPAKALFGDREWYFFSPRDRKYPNGIRPNRAAGSGYWKATGTDKPIVTTARGTSRKSESIGVKKALVFYTGKPPKGTKTNWIMHEYRLTESSTYTNHHIHRNFAPIKHKDCSMRLDDWVLCRIYEKSNQHAMQGAFDDHRHHQGYDSNINDAFLSGLPQATAQQTELLRDHLPKVASLSDFLAPDGDLSMLSRLINEGNPLDMGAGGQEQLQLSMPIHANPNNSSFLGVAEGAVGVKRQRSPEGFAGEGTSAERYCVEVGGHVPCTMASFTDQLGPPLLVNSINQYSYPNHQMLLMNSHPQRP